MSTLAVCGAQLYYMQGECTYCERRWVEKFLQPVPWGKVLDLIYCFLISVAELLWPDPQLTSDLPFWGIQPQFIFQQTLLHLLLQATRYFPQREAWDWLNYRVITFCTPIGECFRSKAEFFLPSEHYSHSYKETGQLFFRDCQLIYYALSSDFFHPLHAGESTDWLPLGLGNS